MTEAVHHPTTTALAARRKELAPVTHRAFEEFSRAVFADGALDRKTKHQEIMESIWVAAQMRAGGAHAHSTPSLQALDAVGAHDGSVDRRPDLAARP